MNKKVLIVSHREGFESDSVIDELKKRNIDFFRFNTDEGEDVSEISFSIRDQIQLLLKCDNKQARAHEFTSAWFQQTYPYSIDSLSPIQSLQRATLSAAFDAIEEFTNCPWLNRPSSVQKASNKIVQLRTAKLSGMEIPETVVSNNHQHIQPFCTEKPSIMKNLNTPWYSDGEGLKAAYTKAVSREILEQKEGLQFAPIIYQHTLNKREECRVFSIDKECFAIKAPSSSTLTDIRRERTTGEGFTRTTFPDEEKDKLLRFKTALDIDTCGADYVIDDTGKWIFLEANTCGAWWWVDQHYNGQIKNAIVDYLVQ